MRSRDRYTVGLLTLNRAATNKAESYNNFAAWCRFGNGGVIADNDPDEQEKFVKFSTLLTNCVFHTTVDMMAAADLAVLSPYLTAPIQRFGVYATDEIALTPDAYDARLGVDLNLPAPDHLASRAAE